ncbi:hypothetical protein L596_000300 [Steinernema carpocapsae]|uniref:Uncharacterized protein n=1 Tax=Steinernema carpocapsae TaxID=34508 RepID=A0A4U8UHL3_STECR|nr:hypothetical protein L596_000300 [Steinernema carpocapsae]
MLRPRVVRRAAMAKTAACGEKTRVHLAARWPRVRAAAATADAAACGEETRDHPYVRREMQAVDKAAFHGKCKR